MASPESDLKLRVVAYLERTERFWMRLNSGTVRKGSRFIRMHDEGTADFVVFRADGTKWCELKAEGQRTAKEREIKQAEFAEKVRGVGHSYAILRSVEELKEFLR